MPAKHAQDLKKTYAQVAGRYELRNRENLAIEDLEAFTENLPEHAKILDLGAGTGRDSEWFVQHGFDVTMFDLSKDMLDVARKKVPQATVVQGDMLEMAFEKETFDGVWANASVLHLTKQEAEKVVRDVYKILKKNGMFVCRLKEGEGEEIVTSEKYGQKMERFFSFYTQLTAENLLEKAGFTEVDSLSETSESGQAWIHVWGVKN